MTTIDQGTWGKLTRATGDKLVARPALPSFTTNLYCALDAHNDRHLLILLDGSEEKYHDQKSRGVSVHVRDLTIQGGTQKKYIDIACLDPTGYPIFDLIGGEIATGLQDESASPIELVKKILLKWRRFWGQIAQPILTHEEQIGLFAELWFLSMWLFPQIGLNSVFAWRGPWGSRHDFEWENQSIEVKATTSVRGRIHKIHGLDQLQYPEVGPLFLFSVILRLENGATHDLPEIIEYCRNCLEPNDEGLAHLENSLAQMGYSPLFDEEYRKTKIRIYENQLFEVRNDFPRLTKENLSGVNLSGIERIDYEINLNSFDHLIVANDPNQLPFTEKK